MHCFKQNAVFKTSSMLAQVRPGIVNAKFCGCPGWKQIHFELSKQCPCKHTVCTGISAGISMQQITTRRLRQMDSSSNGVLRKCTFLLLPTCARSNH